MTSARRILASTVLALCMSLALAPAAAQPALLVKPLAERRVAELPAGTRPIESTSTGLPAWERGQPGQVGNEAAPTVATSAEVRLVNLIS